MRSAGLLSTSQRRDGDHRTEIVENGRGTGVHSGFITVRDKPHQRDDDLVVVIRGRGEELLHYKLADRVEAVGLQPAQVALLMGENF